MKSRRILTTIKAALYFIAFMTIIVACDSEQGMMQRGSGSMDMGNGNWVQILISLIIGLLIGFLIGYLVARRKK